MATAYFDTGKLAAQIDEVPAILTSLGALIEPFLGILIPLAVGAAIILVVQKCAAWGPSFLDGLTKKLK